MDRRPRDIVSAIAAAHGADLRAVTRAGGGLAIDVVFPAPLRHVAGARTTVRSDTWCKSTNIR